MHSEATVASKYASNASKSPWLPRNNLPCPCGSFSWFAQFYASTLLVLFVGASQLNAMLACVISGPIHGQGDGDLGINSIEKRAATSRMVACWVSVGLVVHLGATVASEYILEFPCKPIYTLHAIVTQCWWIVATLSKTDNQREGQGRAACPSHTAK